MDEYTRQALGINPNTLPHAGIVSDAKWKSVRDCLRETIASAPVLISVLPDLITRQKALPISQQTIVLEAAERLHPILAERRYFCFMCIAYDVSESLLNLISEFEADVVSYVDVIFSYSMGMNCCEVVN